VTSVSKKGPLLAERFQQMAEGAQIAAHLLHGDDVEAGDDLRDAQHVAQVSLRRILGARIPTFGQTAERAQVPGSDQQVAIAALAGNDLVDLGREPCDLAAYCRRRIRDVWLGRHAGLLSGRCCPQ
jgi:hypothetical protein